MSINKNSLIWYIRFWIFCFTCHIFNVQANRIISVSLDTFYLLCEQNNILNFGIAKAIPSSKYSSQKIMGMWTEHGWYKSKNIFLLPWRIFWKEQGIITEQEINPSQNATIWWTHSWLLFWFWGYYKYTWADFCCQAYKTIYAFCQVHILPASWLQLLTIILYGL